jgi:hybrid cluster-associated redox disulfide protein
MGSLKDLFFGSDTEREENGMSNEENKSLEAGANGENGNLIDSSMLVGDIIMKHPIAAQFLMECGMGCISCPASQMESLAEACAVHGIDGDEITDALNDYLLEHNV